MIKLRARFVDMLLLYVIVEAPHVDRTVHIRTVLGTSVIASFKSGLMRSSQIYADSIGAAEIARAVLTRAIPTINAEAERACNILHAPRAYTTNTCTTCAATITASEVAKAARRSSNTVKHGCASGTRGILRLPQTKAGLGTARVSLASHCIGRRKTRR